ncbi:hypothetical protein IID22_04620 [Patescibacteria group bacterium]|nr:hypothetical protein [Patescibacteria group bacterium]
MSKPLTVLEHTHNIFVMSNFNGSIYATDDRLFPVMLDLILTKTCQLRGLMRAMDGTPDDLEISGVSAIRDTMLLISGSSHFERSWQVLERTWDELPEADQRRWTYAFPLIHNYYIEWVETLRGYANRSEHPLAVLADELVDTLL